MIAFLRKYSTVILLSLLLILLVLAWLFPSAGLKLGIAFLFLSFLIASLVVLEKHKKAYRNGQITRSVFIRNAVIEITGTGLVMLLAGLLGRVAAGLATQAINHELFRMIAGVVVGLLVGLGLGMLAKQTLRRLVKIPPNV
jgi:hypothetical protein